MQKSKNDQKNVNKKKAYKNRPLRGFNQRFLKMPYLKRLCTPVSRFVNFNFK